MPAVNPEPKTLNTYEPNGTGRYSITFEYELQADVRVGLFNQKTKDYDRIPQDDSVNPWVFENVTTIRFTNGDPGLAVIIFRATDINEPVSEFYTGSAIRAQDLNDNFEQLLFASQELTDQITTISGQLGFRPIVILPGLYPDDIPPEGDLNPGDSLLDENGNLWVWNGEIWIDAGNFQGEDGKAATIEVGTVTTGAPGTDAEITNVGH